MSCDPDDLYCCIYDGPGTDYYTKVQEYTDPGAGVGSNCEPAACPCAFKVSPSHPFGAGHIPPVQHDADPDK